MAGKNVCWTFEKVGRMGGAMGPAFVNTLQNTGNQEKELAREAIQNSCDASDEGAKVTVIFRVETLRGKARDDFVKQLQLLDGLKPRLKAVGRQNWLYRLNEPLTLTYIDDYGTVGLHGKPHDPDSHFFKLLLSLGDPSKASASDTGGSYGYGKSALSMNSRVRTVVAYSAFEKDETGATARLMGCAYLAPHPHDGGKWTGRAWFGIRTGDNETDPLEDEDAHALAEILGFEPRRDGKHGTSLLLVDAPVDAERLLRGIEDWWWPRIEDHDLDIEVRVGGEQRFPKPRARPDLAPFIDCYALACGKSEPLGPHQRREEFNRLDGLKLGAYGLTILTDEQARAMPGDEPRIGAVALVRNPRMVVDYERLGGDAPPAVGVFVADREVDNILKLSEPPAHDCWQEESTRLAELPNAATARKVVRTIRSRLYEQIRRLQRQQEPPRDPQENRLTTLEKELGALLRLGMGPGGDGKKGPVPVEVKLTDPPIIESAGKGRAMAKTRVTLSLKPDTKMDRLQAKMTVRAVVLIDEDEHEGEPIKLQVRPDSKDQAEFKAMDDAESEEAAFIVKLERGRTLGLNCTAGPYEADWVAKFAVHLEPRRNGT